MKEYRITWTIGGGIPLHVKVKADSAKEAIENANALAVKRGWETRILDFDRIEDLSEADPKTPESSDAPAVPTVHMNGTSKKELLEQLSNAYGACRIAGQTLRSAWPNGRDYYVQDSGAFGRAVQEWESRLERIDSVAKELEAIAVGIEEAGS